MSSAQPRFVITLGLALVVIGVGVGVFYLQQGPERSNSKQNGADSRQLSDEQKIAEAERQIFASVPDKQSAHEKAFSAFNAAGMARSTSLPTRDSIHQREAMVKRLDEANTALEEPFKTAEKTLRSDLLRRGFSEYTSAKAAARFAQRANVDLILKIRACERDSNAVFLQLLDLLDIRWGTWKPGARDRVLFNNATDTNAYNALRQQILQIGATQQALQAEVQQRLRDTGKPEL